MYSWFSARPYVSPSETPIPSPRANTAAPKPVGSRESNMSFTTLQLHDWRPRPPGPARRSRDIFAFTRPVRRPAAPAPAAPPAAGLLGGADAKQTALALFRLIGVAEDAGPDGPSRTAIISGPGQLYLVKEGETVASTYRVGRMSPDAVELVDTAGGPPLRLFLK
jgi:hypothetical protein